MFVWVVHNVLRVCLAGWTDQSIWEAWEAIALLERPMSRVTQQQSPDNPSLDTTADARISNGPTNVLRVPVVTWAHRVARQCI